MFESQILAPQAEVRYAFDEAAQGAEADRLLHQRKDAFLAIGRILRNAKQALPANRFKAFVEARGLHVTMASLYIAKANQADGIAPPSKPVRTATPRWTAKEILDLLAEADTLDEAREVLKNAAR